MQGLNEYMRKHMCDIFSDVYTENEWPPFCLNYVDFSEKLFSIRRCLFSHKFGFQ